MPLTKCEDCEWRGHRDECAHDYYGREPVIVAGFTVSEYTYSEVCPVCHSRNLIDKGETEE